MSLKRKRPASLDAFQSPRLTRKSKEALDAEGFTNQPLLPSTSPVQEPVNISFDTEVSEDQREIDRASAELKIDNYQPARRGPHENLVKDSLRTLLECLPEDGRDNVVIDINTSHEQDGDQGIYEVFENIYTGLRARMSARTRPPTITESPVSRRKENAESIFSQLDTTNHREKLFRTRLLRRDRNRCVITGDMDRDERTRCGSPPDIEDFGPVHGVHIVPFSYGSWKDGTEMPREIAKAWEVLFRCFPKIHKIGFEASKINNLSNGMILRDWLHTRFREFGFAFRKTETPHVYDIETFKSFSRNERSLIPSQVSFQGCVGAIEDRPSPELLDCHWRLAKILHASAMGKAFEEDIEKWEDVKGIHGLHPLGGTNVEDILCSNLDLWAYSHSFVSQEA